MSGKGTMMKSQKKCRIVHQSKTIPRELVQDILSRLQVKPLLRFKTVSKQWCNIITSPTFIKLHYERSIYRLHVLCSSNSLPVAKFYTLDLDEERPLNDYFRVERLRVNLKGYSHKESVGSCNGIVCLRNSDGWGFTLLNPATRTHVKLPNILVDKFRPIAAIGTNNNPLRGRNYGLGYDSITDDYKVVKIEQYCRNDREKMDGLYVTCAMVYSLKKNEWLMSQDKFYCLNDRNNGVSYNNALHFLAVTNKPWVSMVSFNLSTRKFDRDLMSLSDVTGTGYASRTLALLKGSLHIMATIQQRSSNYLKTTSEVDLWMMKDYSTKSWCRLAKIVVPLESPRLITYSKSLTQILFCYKRLNYNLSEFFLADLPSGQEKARHCLGAPISPPLPMLQPYVESLVTLKRLP